MRGAVHAGYRHALSRVAVMARESLCQQTSPSRTQRQEKDKFEEEEADDLINFVEGLDFDKYVGAPDFPP